MFRRRSKLNVLLGGLFSTIGPPNSPGLRGAGEFETGPLFCPSAPCFLRFDSLLRCIPGMLSIPDVEWNWCRGRSERLRGARVTRADDVRLFA